MNLIDIKLRLGVSGSHLREINRLLLNYPVNPKTCEVHNLLYSFEVSNFHLFVIFFFSLITGKTASFTVKQSFSCLHSMSKDGRKISLMHVTLKAGVKYIQNATITEIKQRLSDGEKRCCIHDSSWEAVLL